ncbi:MAG: LarC family nickel insertion protein [Firmicutes bacterium]|nr:LarC family nickel insertion protein [Bacillota bacterium]
MIGREETVTVIETAIDDMNPEIYSYLIDQLLKNGALDAYTIPVYMKKGRPASLLSVICKEEMRERLLEVIFAETTTLGVRMREEKRRVLARKFFDVETPWGKVRIKAGYRNGEGGDPLQIAPEYEDCRKIAEEKGVPLKEVYAAARQAAEKIKNKERRVE